MFPALRRRLAPAVLAACAVAVILQWLPGTAYPVVSDTAVYALLGRSAWTAGAYEHLGQPYAKHLPLHAIVSYPLAHAFGPHLGMQLSSLLAGLLVLLATFLLARRAFGETTALLAAAALSVHHGFVLMTMLGSADLLFTALFLLSVHAFLRAEESPRAYLAAGLFAGLACLTRYNGLPLFPLFLLWVAWKRRPHLREPLFWAGGALGAAIIGLWPLRNWLTLGSPFANDYAGELAEKSPGIFAQLLRNLAYYANPLHNVLPLPLLLAFHGLWRHGRRQAFLALAMLAGWAIALVWWVQGIRFAFAGYPILLAFSAAGALALLARVPARWRATLAAFLLLGTVVPQAAVTCVYDYGACNAWADRTVGLLPRNIGLSTEGFHSMALARAELNRRAESGAAVVIRNLWDPWFAEGVYRGDLRVLDAEAPDLPCPRYRLTEEPGSDAVLYVSPSAPRVSLVREEC